MSEKINLTAKELLNKKFSTELSGYNATEVDRFLDLILSDYKYYEEVFYINQKNINDKNYIIKDKDELIEKMSMEISSLKKQIESLSKDVNIDVINELKEIKQKINN